MDLTVWMPVIAVFAGSLATAAGAWINAFFGYRREIRQAKREDERRREEWAREDRIQAEQNKQEEKRQRVEDRLRVYKNFIACTTFPIPTNMPESRELLNKLTASYLELLAHPAPSDGTKPYAEDLYETAQAALDIEENPVEGDEANYVSLEFGPLARDMFEKYRRRIDALVTADPTFGLQAQAGQYPHDDGIRLEFLERQLAQQREQFLEATRSEVE